MVVKPAAGPETPRADPLTSETKSPPTMPEMIPAYKGRAGGKGNAKAERQRDQEYIQSGGKVVPEKEFALISLPSLSGQITHWTSVVRPLS